MNFLNERPGTDHVISGPMRGLKKTAPDGAKPQTNGHGIRVNSKVKKY